MIILLHVIIALSSMLFTSYLYFVPTKRNFIVSYILIGLTLLSGTYLVLSTSTKMLSACEAGLAYIGGVLVVIVAAQRKYAKSLIQNKKD
jgi:hypothetical protein